MYYCIMHIYIYIYMFIRFHTYVCLLFIYITTQFMSAEPVPMNVYIHILLVFCSARQKHNTGRRRWPQRGPMLTRPAPRIFCLPDVYIYIYTCIVNIQINIKNINLHIYDSIYIYASIQIYTYICGCTDCGSGGE